MNISKLILIYSLSNNEIISSEIIKKCADKEQFPFLLLPRALANSQIKINSYVEIKNYIDTLADNFFNLYSYNTEEQQWYKFYMMLKVYHNSNQDTEQIVSTYDKLPELITDKDYLLWMAYNIKIKMLSYYTIIGKDTTKLINEINSTPMYIKYLFN